MVIVNPTAAGFTITFPTVGNNPGKVWTVKNIGTNFNVVTLSGPSTTLNTEGETVKIYDDGAAYRILDRYIPSAWADYTPTGAWTANTTFTGKWRRVGDSVECQVKAAITGTPTTATFTASIPSGLTIDTAKMLSPSGGDNPMGVCELISAANAYNATVVYSTTTVVRLAVIRTSTADTHIAVSVSQAVPGTFANNDSLNLLFMAPVTGWAG